MKHINMKDLVEQVLDALHQSGMRVKQIKDCKYCGLYPISQYFSDRGLTAYTKDVADEFILQIRAEYEQGKISRWKWTTVRRSAELLEKYHTEGTVILPSLPKWEVLYNPLHQPPSSQLLLEADNLLVLVYQTKQELLRFGYREKTISNYVYDGFDAILRYCGERGITQYEKDAIDSFVAQTRTGYENHSICRSVYQNVRKVATLLDEYHQTGKIELKRVPAWGLRRPGAYYTELLNAFCRENEQTGALAHSTISVAHSAIRNFLFELEDMGYVDFGGITLSVVSKCMSHNAKRYAGGLGSMLFAIRSFLRFLHRNGTTQIDLSIAMPEMVAKRRVIRQGFDTIETEKMLCSANVNYSTGKRDYAIMLTAIQTGLRAVDIVNLKRQDIDWRNYEIRIIQSKTGHPLSLPLEYETGNAIADYLLNERPKCDLPFIFLCGNRPYRPLKNRSASAMISRYMQRTGIDKSDIPRRGFHSFRRSFGAGLLESEISLDMLSELLGHTHMDSAKPYLAANELGLKSCAIGLISIEKAGEGW